MLLDRQRVDWAESLQLLADHRGFGPERLVVELQILGAGEQLVDGLLPFRFQPFTDRRSLSGELGIAELRGVQLLPQCRDVVPHFP